MEPRAPIRLDCPRLRVDFNERLDHNHVALSQTNEVRDADGNIVRLSEGLEIHVFEEDPESEGRDDYLVADGICRENCETDWSQHIRWLCEIDETGIRHLSDVSALSTDQ